MLNMEKWKPFSLLIAGSLAGGLVRIYMPSPVSPLWQCIIWIAFLFLLFLGSGLMGSVLHQGIRLRREKFVFTGWKVGVLNDAGWESAGGEIASGTVVSPEEWKRLIEDQAAINRVRLKVEMVNLRKSIDPFHVILNPYGGVYPEYNSVEHKTLDKIFNYVDRGGIFVSIADIPGYYEYNSFLKRRLDATKPVYKIENNIISPYRIFSETPFIKRLGLDIKNVESLGPLEWKGSNEKINEVLRQMGKIKVARAAIIEKNVTPILRNDQNPAITPLFTIPYGGKGTFLISLAFQNWEERMKEILIYCLFSLIAKEDRRREENQITRSLLF